MYQNLLPLKPSEHSVFRALNRYFSEQNLFSLGGATDFIKRGAEMVLVPERRKERFGAQQEGGIRTLLSERDADLLRMAYWCQYLSPDNVQNLSSKEESAELVRLGLLKVHRNSGAFVITKTGISLLRDMLDGRIPDISQPYHASAIERRLRFSKLALTAYKAGLNIFIASAGELQEENTLFFTAYDRGRGQNPWGGTRVAAIAHIGDAVYAIHYIFPRIGALTLTDELAAFSNNTSRLACTRRAFLFAGDSYSGILEELARESDPKKTSKSIPYKIAYCSIHSPVHLLSCDEVGARQLKIMSIPHYRMKLTKAALAGHYRSPPNNVPEWDAMYKNSPLITAADMNLRRVEAGIKQARESGYESVALLSLQEQGALLSSLYGEDRFVGVYYLTDSALCHFAGGSMELHRPKPTQYLTEKGGVIDTPLIQSYRKAGR